ncbi:beta-phosphoglucomutase [Anaerosporobacter sp.]|uniref:beta-phosphoglucomutase n=1 Tax=Anaerosporobacter sp. TaxID=1872529 RepID=UPI00286F27B7|nr:beta-phosphoglucomutase [Anaerosporobacter sp.]
MKYKGIIFDLDGVICSTDEYHYLAWKSVADSLNIFFDETVNNRLRGVSRVESLEIILENYDIVLSEKEKLVLMEKKNTLYKELLMNMSPENLSEEVKNTLDELRQRGYVLAIGSSSKNARYILDRLGLGTYFDVISDGTNITYSKPNPEVFLKAAEQLKLQPQDCLVVEDATAGVEAACRGGFDCAGIGDAAGDGRATYGLGRFGELLKFL